jgi:flagellar hook-associated protein 2
MTGLYSGLDTESLVSQLTDAYQTKVDNAQKKVTKAEWKKEAWASLNTKLLNFYKGALSTFKSTGTYSSKAVNGDLSGVKITANSKAANGTHKIQVTSTASAQMWTGHKINDTSVTATSYENETDGSKKVMQLRSADGYASSLTGLNGKSFSVDYGAGTDAEVNINIDDDTTIDSLVEDINNQLDGTGLTASFADGALTFTNISAEKTDDGEYTEGHAVTIKADKDVAESLGLTYNENGTTINQLSADNETNAAKGSVVAYQEKKTADSSVGSSTKLADLGIAEGTVIKVNGVDIRVDRTTTLSSLATSMSNAGINANYDANQGRFYISSKSTGESNAFTIDVEPVGADGVDTETQKEAVLAALGLNLKDGEAGKIDATDASLIYNGVTYTQSDNSFSINGLTIDVTSTGEQQTFTIDNDVDGIYDKVKNFIKEYNSLISEMNSLYDAESSRGYDPLTSDEKDAMTDEEVEKWETKIKSSLLRRDSTIGSLLTSMRTTLNKSVEVTNSDGTTSKYALSSFGIVTGNYSENGQLHIYGDEDDSDYSGEDDKLKAAVSANPDALIKTLTTLGSEMYSNLQKAMKKTTTSSSLTFYDDVTLDSDIENYKDDVSDLQDKMQDEEDKYYSQFSTMETALSKLQAQQTYISQLLGS